MVEMVYKPRKELEILAEGEYKNIKYVIISQGLFPMAYIENNFEFNTFTSAQEYASPHGSFTYLGKAYWNDNDNSKYLSWDYAHCGDYSGIDLRYPEFICANDKKYTTETIFEEVKKVIECLITIKEKTNGKN